MGGAIYPARRTRTHIIPHFLDSGVIIARLSGHESSVKLLSIYSSGQYLLSVSSGNSMLWELADSYTHLRTLSGGETVGVQEVFALYVYVDSLFTVSPLYRCSLSPIATQSLPVSEMTPYMVGRQTLRSTSFFYHHRLVQILIIELLLLLPMVCGVGNLVYCSREYFSH